MGENRGRSESAGRRQLLNLGFEGFDAIEQLPDGGGFGIGQLGMVKRRIGDVAAANDAVGHADGGAVGGHGGQNNGTGPNASTLTDVNVAEDFGSSSDDDAVAHGGVSLAGLFARAAQGDALVNQHVVAHDRRFANHDTHAMVDDQAAPQLRTGMNFDARQAAAEVANESRQ